MAPTRRRLLRWSALIIGTSLAVAGLFLIGAYAWGAVEVLVEDLPDKSWLFWGLGFALPGVILLGGGTALLFVGVRMGRQGNAT